MKKKLLFIGVALSTLISCGKYGYDFQDGYQDGDPTGKDIEKDMSYIDKSMFDKARVYPGMVGANVRRIQDTTINLPLNFRRVSANDLKVRSAPGAIFSTGLYAPAGENVRITVPSGVVGLTAQVGAHMDDLAGKEGPRRQQLIYTVKELMPGDNYIRNPFGGLLWIKAALSHPQAVPVKVSGAVKSPDFIHGVTNQAAWIKEVEMSDVPWLELRSKRSVFAVPRSLVLQYKNDLRVAEVLDLWEDIYEKDYYDWMGLSENNANIKNSYPDLPERAVLDIHPSAGYAHASSEDGFPWVAQQDKHWFLMFSNYNYVMGTFSQNEGAWGTFHEIGHNYQQSRAWSWSALGETTNNLFVFKAAERFNNPAMASHPALKGAFERALLYAKSSTAKNFNSLSEYDEGIRAFFRLTPFLQIFNKVKGKNNEPGWDFMTYVYTQARNSNQSFSLDQAKIDFFYRSLCDYTATDYQRFFTAWGIPVSSIARREMRLKYPPMNKALWTYDPWSKTGGDAAIGTKYDLNNTLFTYTPNAQTATNEGAANTLKALNDGDYNTYWHTCYSGCPIPTLPVQIDVDLKGIEAFKGFYYGNRHNHSMYNKHVRAYKSNDGKVWTLLGDYPNQLDIRGQRIEISFDQIHEARYFRLEFPSYGVNANHVAVAELGLFFDI
ncbi:M60 family metallopeptidase [Sphingobacterium psychroaquaticum]|uniref:F5/8 type C domain-containing protein n=1 Tax=Sphingobacterium psychroaquaticum TaxID=561061 RepID=A0A1X7LBI5_9SPHI|nr:M60 family metallopeptidase [Sphingobacterium psychroaquaticum]SMG51060.1 F5/8 type C domain-containing protein [Sphingobacterium psychroaquaticum]